jgi:outer membrane immunogenic protein
VVGVQGGYNLQLGSAVVGIEADYSWANMDGSTAVPGVSITASVDTTWSVRGRLGWLITPSVMLYGTAGYGGLDAEVRAVVSGLALTGTTRLNGLVFGGGAELLLTRSLMLRAEALHYAVDGNSFGGADNGGATQLRLGISYKF